jgi:EF-P beta-lysylation protein EpmB
MSYNPPIEFVKKDIQLPDHLKKMAKIVAAAKDADYMFPLLVTDSFSSRIDWNNPCDPLLLQILPTPAELQQVKGFSNDPLGEVKFKKAPGIIKKYHGRVILQLTGACPIHCRYCFRRHNKNADIPKTLAQWQEAIEVVRADQSIREVIYSGGDPLMLPDAKILEFSNRLAEIPHVQRLRIHTRVPVASPQRVTPSLIQGLKKIRLTVTMVIHMNHPAEMDGSVKSALESMVDAGIPLYNQSVLLKGVNDSVETLVALSEALLQARVTPYYLHILDPVSGAAHFRVDGEQGKDLVMEMRNYLPGFGVPLLVQEIPGDGYKLPL